MFLGRGDLGLSLSNAVDPGPALADAGENVVHIAKANGKAVSAVVQSMKSDEAKWLIDLGVTAMMVAPDLAFMRQAASAALNDFNETMKGVGQTRSEEGRVGQESVSTCRARWSPTREKKKEKREHGQ